MTDSRSPSPEEPTPHAGLSLSEFECGTVPTPDTKAIRTWRAQIVKGGLLVGGTTLVPHCDLPALITLASMSLLEAPAASSPETASPPPTFLGIPVRVDPTVPPDEARFYVDGKRVGTIVGLPPKSVLDNALDRHSLPPDSP